MASSKRKRVQVAERTAAIQKDADLKMATELAANLPVDVMKDTLVALFTDPKHEIRLSR